MRHRKLIQATEPSSKQTRKKKRSNLIIPITVLSIAFVLILYDFIRNVPINTQTSGNPQVASMGNTDSDSNQVENDLLEEISFKVEQTAYPRVREAYEAKEDSLTILLRARGITSWDFEMYLRAFKKEQMMEVWIREHGKLKFRLVATYDFCATIGNLGPKRKQGDNQIPEGFYHIDRFNPASNFHLSLGINYPNRVDRIKGDTTGLGGNIFIYGGCETDGGITLTDEKIKDIYILAVEAKNAGQIKIPVSIFPSKLDDESFTSLQEEYEGQVALLNFWKSLKTGYDYFQECKELPAITLTEGGSYIIRDKCR